MSVSVRLYPREYRLGEYKLVLHSEIESELFKADKPCDWSPELYDRFSFLLPPPKGDNRGSE